MRCRTNGIYFQTKTGEAIADVLEILDGKKNVAWYITVTCADDEISKKVEPGAPPTSERLEWAKRLAKAGCHVIVAFNPLVEAWMPKKKLDKIITKLTSEGIEDFYFDSLHLEENRKYPDGLLDLVGKTVEYINSLDNFLDVEELMLSVKKGDNLHFRYHNQRYADLVYYRLITVLEGGFLPVSTFQLFMDEARRQGFQAFYWEDFFDWMSQNNKELFEKELPTSWLERYTYVQQRQVYMEHPPLRSYKDLLRLIWNDDRFTCSLLNHRGYKSLEKDDCGDVILGLRPLVVDQQGKYMRNYQGRFIEIQDQ